MPIKKAKKKKLKLAGCPDPAVVFKPGRKKGKSRSLSYIKGYNPCIEKATKTG